MKIWRFILLFFRLFYLDEWKYLMAGGFWLGASQNSDEYEEDEEQILFEIAILEGDYHIFPLFDLKHICYFRLLVLL